MKIRRMILLDLDQVVKLHVKTLPYTISSKMGLTYLAIIYKKVLANNEVHLCLVAHQGNEILGAITATKNLKITQNILNPIRSFSLIQIVVKNLLAGRISLKELLEKLYFEFAVFEKFGYIYPTILTLFVRPDRQRLGIGKNLLKAVISKFKKNGLKEIFVDTLITNYISISFYKKIGFKNRIKLNDSFVFGLKIANKL